MVTDLRKPVPRNRGRRVSLPAFGQTPKLQTSLAEARSMVTDILSTENLSPQLAARLRCVSALLNQHQNSHNISESAIQPQVAEDPVTGEQVSLSTKQHSSSRLSPVVWSTVTSATGLPAVAPEPSRSRSASCWKTHTDTHIGERTPSPSFEVEMAGDTENRITVRDRTKFDTYQLNDDPLLDRISELDFPIFNLYDRSPTTILSNVSYKIFYERNLFQIFGINLRKFFSFFHELEMGYYNIPYHNRIHATDVEQLVYCLFTKRMRIIVDARPNADDYDQNLCSILSSLEIMALFTAAAMHDYEHPGKTNAFLVATKDSKAIMYNDRSVLENHHAASSWRVLSKRGNDWTDCLDDAEYQRFRYLVIESILATDLKLHFDILSKFSAKVAEGSAIDWENEQDRLLICQLCIKMADISAPMRPGEMHRSWTNRILEEFYQQGDEERKRGFPVSAYMDRANAHVAKLQDSFITHVVSPLADVMHQNGLLPMEESEEESSFITNLHDNHNYWLAQLDNPHDVVHGHQGTSEMAVINESENEDANSD